VVFGDLVFKLSVWCGAEGCVSGLRAASVASIWHFISTYLELCYALSYIHNKKTIKIKKLSYLKTSKLCCELFVYGACSIEL
jgi:hypothetical protein